MRDTKGDLFRGALVASIIGGAVLALAMVIPAAGNAQGLWPGQFAAYPFIGGQVFRPGFELGAMTLGTLIHFLVAFAWSLAFLYLVRRMSKTTTMLLSVPFGIVVWAVMFLVVVPLVGARDVVAHYSRWLALLQHIAFGVSVALTYVLLQPQNFRFGKTRREIAA